MSPMRRTSTESFGPLHFLLGSALRKEVPTMAAHIPPKQFINPCNDPNLNVPPVVGSSRLGEPGVFGLHCAGGNGVHGHSTSGVAVRGDSEQFLGVFGRSLKNDGIQGRSAARDHAGVSAIGETNGFGLFAMSSGGEVGHFECPHY